MKKRIISMVLFVALLLQLSGGISFATDPEEGVSYSFDHDTSTLYIYGEGSGVMEDYRLDYYETRAPWVNYAKIIQRVVVEEGVAYIGNYAFADCTMLEYVYLPDSLTGIGEGAFYNCSYLQSVDIPDSVTAIGEGAFLDCTYLDSVELPSKLARIEAMTFMSCECLTEITVPASVSYIGDYAFGYSGMSTITMLGSEPELGVDVFIKEDTDFQLVTYAPWITMSSDQWGQLIYSGAIASGNCGAQGDKLTWTLNCMPDASEKYRLTISGEGAMEDYGFVTANRPWEKYATQISEVILPEGLTRIGDEAFYSFSAASKITIPDSVTEIGVNAFTDSSFGDIYFKGDVPFIETDAFSGVVAYCYYPKNNNSWKEFFADRDNDIYFGGKLMWSPLAPEPNAGLSFEVKNRVLTVSGKGILDYVPYELPPYYKVIIEEGVTGIADYALSYTAGLASVEIPASVTYVGMYAFDGCPNLVEVHFAGKAPEIGSNAFGSAKVFVYYPADAAGWDEIVNAEPGIYGSAITWVPVDEAGGGEGGEIGPVTPPVEPPATAIEPVTDITAFVSEDDEIIVQWVYNYEGEYSFNVYRSSSEDGDFSLMGSTSEGMFTDTALSAQPGITYYYYVTAVSGGAESDKGSVVSAALPMDKTAPTILDVWPGDKVTLCKQAKFQISAKDNYSLFGATVKITPYGSDTAALVFDQVLETKDNSALFSFDVDLSQLPGGTYYVNYTVIDSSGIASSRSATVTVYGYELPSAPIVSAQASYKTAELSWTYSGDMGLMDHFAIYSCDENGENLRFVTSVRSFGCSVDIPKDQTQCFIVEAVDRYGESCKSEPIAVTSLSAEYVKPVAVIAPENITGTVGQEVTFSGVNSTDNDAIASYAWDFGDGSTGEGDVCTHSYTEAGSYTVKLTVTDESGNVGVSYKTVDIYDISGADATHALMTVTVKNAYEAGTPALEGVMVTVFTADRSFETSGVTAADGTVQLVVPLGEVTVTAGIAGFIPDSKTVTVSGDEQGRYSCLIGMQPLDVSVVDGSLTVTEMTMDEIIEAGIDVSAPENQHVWKFAVVLEFIIDGVPHEVPVSGYVNDNDDVIKGPDFWPWNWDETDDDPNKPGEDYENWFEDLPFEIGIFPVAKNIYLVIYGQAHWLKEMFNVELLVANNNQMYPITNCVANLNLPKGMSLAAMIEDPQSLSIDIGQIAPGKTAKANWYVCGDEVGEYFLTASVSGIVDGETFSTEFETDKPVKVYAGEALCMYVSCDQYAAKGLTYTVDFELQNVSHKELYNVGMEIFGAEFFAALDIQQIIDKVESVGYRGGGEDWRWADGAKLFAETLKPGESLKGTFEIRFAEDLAQAGVRYFLNQALALTMEGSTTVVPVEFRIRDNTFWYNSTACGNTDNQTNFIYEDEYFFQSAEIFNPQLAYATACLSVAGYNSSGAAAGGYTAEAAGKNVKDLLVKMGFAPENIELESRYASYAGKPKEDSIAAAIASKPLSVGEEEYILIALVVRGGAYEMEWHDNFLVGTKEDHIGFSNAANKVINALNEYIISRGITGKVKLWITGYSRSSATANLAAARIVDGALSDSVSLAHGDLYAYGFATPAGTTSGNINDARYSTIYSIVNPVDVVPMVAPACWGFDRYGKTFYLPSAGLSKNYDDYHEQILSTYAYITGGQEYGLDSFHMKKLSLGMDFDLDYELGSGFDFEAKVTFIDDDNNNGMMQEAFLLEFTEILFEDGFKDAQNYTAYFQAAVCDLAATICADANVRVKFIDDLGKNFNWGDYVELFLKGWADDGIKAILSGGTRPLPDDSVFTELLEKFEHDLASFIAEYDGIDVSYDYARDLVDKLEGVLVRCIVCHINYTLTLVENGAYVGNAHYPDVYLSWARLIQNEDSYNPNVWDDILINERPSYRKVTVNCPVNVEVYDAEGTLVAQILEVAKENGGTEKKVTKIEDSSVIAYVDANDQMIIYLPYNGEYDVKISANSDGELNYSITEINLGSGGKDKICYSNIPIKAGDVLTGTVSQMTPDSDDGDYALIGPDNQEIRPGESLSDEEIVFHDVTLEAEGEGYIMGGGSIEHGNFAKMIAIPEENYVFRGWFDGDELLSTQREYRMIVTEDVTVTAKFALIDGSRYKIDSAALSSDGTELENIPKGSFTATVAVTNRLVESSEAVVVLAAYTADGQFRWMVTAPVSGCPMGQSAQVELTIDNAYEDIAQIRVFVMAADGHLTPLSQTAVLSAKG